MKTHDVADRLQRLGRGRDTILAHITPREAAMLKAKGGRGSRNPMTGLLEFETSGEGPGDAIGATTGDATVSSPVSSGDTSDTVSLGALGETGDVSLDGVTITGSGQQGGFGGDIGFSFDDSMIPNADPRGGVGNMSGLGQPPTFMDQLLKKGQGLLTNIALAKGIGMLAAATGIPGLAIAGIGSAISAANNAPPGQSGPAVANSVGNTVSGAITNTATGGISGALASMGITAESVFGSPTGPAPSGDVTGGADTAAANGVAGPASSIQSYSPAIDYLRGGYGLYQANKLAQLAKGTAAEQAAGGQLSQLISDPSSITKQPGYEAGLQAVQRAAAGKGYLASGNLSVALSKYGTDFYNNSLSTLNQIANQNAAIRQQNRNNSIALAGQALNSLGYGFGRSNRGAPVQTRPYTDAGMQEQANLYTEAPVTAPSDLGDFYG